MSHWAVTVSMNGEPLVTTESNCLSGKSDFTDAEADVIRDAARHLKAFIGDPRQVVCECPGYERVKGPYPSGICRECGRWFPGKPKEAVA